MIFILIAVVLLLLLFLYCACVLSSGCSKIEEKERRKENGNR